MEKHHPPIVIMSGAIGSGKGTIIQALVYELKLRWVPTHTTRPMRHDDYDLSRRVFDTEANFLRHLARGEFIESVHKGGNHYGLLRSDLDKELRANHPVVIELTVEGGLAVAKAYPHTLLIFVTSTEKVRRERIGHRGMDRSEMEKRMKEAAAEERIAQKEYDYLIENIEDHPEEAIDAIKALIVKEFPELATHEQKIAS